MLSVFKFYRFIEAVLSCLELDSSVLTFVADYLFLCLFIV
jgi:hypothetical protein